MMESAARDRAPPAGGQRSGQADHGRRERYYATQQTTFLSREANSKASGRRCNSNVSKRNSIYSVGARSGLAVQLSSRPSASKSMAASSSRALASFAARAA